MPELADDETDLFTDEAQEVEADGPDLSHITPDLRALARPIDGLAFDPKNARQHGDRNLEAIGAALDTFTQRKPIVVNRRGMIVEAGNGTLEAARAMIAAGDPRWAMLAMVLVDDDPETATGYGLADNRTAELAEWNQEVLGELLNDLEASDDLAGVGWNDDELAALYAELDDTPKPERSNRKQVPLPENPVSELGGFYELGPHRVACGDSGNQGLVLELLGGDRDVWQIVTDPPYCSGGWQESDKRRGSVGTDTKHHKVARDTLSTRGYIALIQRVMGCVAGRLAYVFTDWRMWVNLFDAMEAIGYPARSMIVWDKSNPGMGRGWRAQHELIMCCATHTDPLKDLKRSKGNVIQASRTGNELHTTQKPLELLETIIDVARPEKGGLIYDPFAGSGSTMIAAGKRPTRLIELDPGYVDIIRWRWGQYAKTNGLPLGDAIDELGAPREIDLGAR
jgi:DNA modification methylase